MKVCTLTDYVDGRLKSDEEFAENYAGEQILNSIAEMIVEAKKD